jgi:glutamine synthetase adenylyltransferase
MDLDFLAQFFQLLALREGRKLIGSAPPEVFAWAAEAGRMSPEIAASMTSHYAFLRQLESRCRLLFETESSRAPEGGEKAESLGRALKELLPEGERDWQAYLLRLQRQNRRWFNELIAAA